MEAQETRRDPRESWFVWVGPGHLAQGEMAISYQRWFSHEHTYRYLKQDLSQDGHDHHAQLQLIKAFSSSLTSPFDLLGQHLWRTVEQIISLHSSSKVSSEQIDEIGFPCG